MEGNIQKIIAREIADLLIPLEGAAYSEAILIQMFRTMGWNFDEDTGMPLASITNAVDQIHQLNEGLQAISENNEISSLEQFSLVLDTIKPIFASVETLPTAFDGTILTEQQVKEVAHDVIHILLVAYLEKKNLIITEILRWIEAIQIKEDTGTILNDAGKIIRHPYAFEVLNFDKLTAFINNPIEAINDIYFSPFDRSTIIGSKAFTDKLFPKLGRIAQTTGAVSIYGIKPAYGIDFGTVGNEMASGTLSLAWHTPLDEIDFGINFAYSPQERGNLGWVIVPFGNLNFDGHLDEYYFQIKSILQIAGIIIDDSGIVTIESEEGLTKVNAEILAHKAENFIDGFTYLIGEREGTRLEIGKISIGSSFEATTAGVDFDIHFHIEEAKIVLSGKGQDGFISNILPPEDVAIPFDFKIGYSNEKSFYLGGNAGLDLILPVHINFFGLLTVSEIYLEITAKNSGIAAEMAITCHVALGPVLVTISRIGLQSEFNWDKSEKNLGFADLSLGFKSPSEVGFQIDTASVKGGGYLVFEPDNSRYFGLAELSIQDKFTVKAVAIINTELPDGQEGYSFLLLITAEFQPIHLGFGFTLEGVGGLIGIHRSMNLEAIREKVKGNTFDQVLFPEDPINNVNSIIASIDSIFPIQEGQYSFGIMGEIGWGAPKQIDIKAGLIFQAPNFKMAIIGTAKSEIVRTSVPKDGEEPKEVVLLRIQISFMAWVEPERSLLRFDASLFKSEILGKKLTGDAALRLRGGDDPYFMISVGGFHPEFEPPKGLGLGKLNRIEIAFRPESVDVDITAKFYVALTSNTVQTGAELTAAYAGSGFRIEGGIGFDALLQFRPIYFKVGAWGIVTIHIFGSSWGLGIKGTIEGPYPYRFSLYVTLDLGWAGSYTKRIPSFTIGSDAQGEISTINVLEELKLVIEDDRSWNPVLLDRSEVLVTLRDRRKEFADSESEKEAEAELIVHPFGGISIDQDRVPLDVTLKRFGHHQPEGNNFFSLTVEGEDTESLERFFAPAQFFEMNKEERLTRSSFEKMNSGIQIGDFKELQTGSRILAKEVQYETEYYDPHSTQKPATTSPKAREEIEDFIVWRANASIAKSALGKKQKRPAKANALTFTNENKAEDEFTIIHQDGTADFPEIKTTSETLAQQQLEKLILDQPELEDKLVVVPMYEIA